MHRHVYIIAIVALLTQGCSTFDARGKTFVGEVRYSASSAMVTTFYDEPARGSYQYYSSNSKKWIRGTLSKCEYRTVFELKCWWTDPTGQGVALFRFDPTGQSFDGLWDIGDAESPSNMWTGEKFQP